MTEPSRQTMIVVCHCGARHVLDVGAARDPRGELVALSEGWQLIKGGTLTKAARRGELVAYELARGQLASWTSDLVEWVESHPAKVKVSADRDNHIPAHVRRDI